MSKENRGKLDMNRLRSIVAVGQLWAEQKLIVELL